MSIQSQLNESIIHELRFVTDNKSFEISPLLLGFITEQIYRFTSLNASTKCVDIAISIANNRLNYIAKYLKKKNQLSHFNSTTLSHLKQFLELKYPHRHQIELNEVSEFIEIKLHIIESEI
jgi:hypothetical protein